MLPERVSQHPYVSPRVPDGIIQPEAGPATGQPVEGETDMKRWLFCAIIAIIGLAPACALAQDMIIPEQMQLNYTLTAGAVYAVNSHVLQRWEPIVGIAWYGPMGDEFGANSALGLSADWIPLQRNDNETVSLIPMLINYRVYGYAAGYRLFTTLGIGVTVASDDVPEMRLNDGANFGWTAGFGIDITNQFYGQFKFIGSSNPGDDGLAGVQLGYRF